MISAISGEPAAASNVVNAYLRELSSVRRGRGPRETESIRPAAASQKLGGKSELTEDEKKQVDELQKRDREVRQHEAAHKSAAGQYAKGGASYEYTRGPDGRQYASGGEVQIDTSEVSGDSKATIQKMQQIRQAASAPAQPSGQDRKVAAQAAQVEAKAQQELREDKQTGDSDTDQTRTSPIASPIASASANSSGPTPVGSALVSRDGRSSDLAKSTSASSFANAFAEASPAGLSGRFIDVSA
jgi:SprA family protein